MNETCPNCSVPLTWKPVRNGMGPGTMDFPFVKETGECHDKIDCLRRQLAQRDARIAALEAENALAVAYKQRAEKAEAACAAMPELAAGLYGEAQCDGCDSNGAFDVMYDGLRNAANPGQAILDELTRLRAVVERLRNADIVAVAWEDDEDVLTLNGKPIGATFHRGCVSDQPRWWPYLKAELLGEPVAAEAAREKGGAK